MIEVNSFAELRSTTPTKSGDIASLKRYYNKDSSFHGGGDFVGFLSPTPPRDDAGTIASGSDFFWKRIINDPDEVTLYHFGARGDGVTDDSNAFKQMLTWAQRYNQNAKSLGVRFPAGKFMLTPIDLTGAEIAFFYIQGDHNPHGALPRTIIISDKSNNPVFKVTARRTVIQGIIWNGQAGADIINNTGMIVASMCSNQQPFFENTTVAGQSVVVSKFRAQNIGGTAIKLLDTLDTKFEQIYTINTFARVIDIGWSGTATGVWDHSTAIEISNCNFQTGYGDSTLYMPRVTQGILRNVWIEHTRYPGNLSEGQWLIDALSVEDCDTPFDLSNSRVQLRQLNLQSGSRTNLSIDSVNHWLSSYEYGWRRDESFGTTMSGSMKTGWYSGHRISNTSGSDKWYRLGKLNLPVDNQQWVMEIVSKGSNDALSGTAGNPVTTMASCLTWLNISRCANAIYADIQHKGFSSVLDVKLNRMGLTNVEVWLKLRAASGDTLFNLTTTGPSRFDAGVCSLFNVDLSEVSDLSTIGTTSPNARLSFHNGLAGFGANEQGVITLATASADAPTASSPAGYITININGTDRKVAYY